MDALLVIDVQQGMFADPAMPPHDGPGVVARIAALVERSQAAGRPVIFIQHDSGPGDMLARGEPGFELHPDLAPLVRAPAVVKRFCSAFQETELAGRLAALGAKHLAICGMQTEFCVDTTCRAAFERGFAVTLASDAHSTFDGAIPAREIIRHHNATLASGFARVVPAADI